MLRDQKGEIAVDNLHLRLFIARVVTLSPHAWDAAHLLNSFWRFYCNTSDGAYLHLDDGLYPLAANRLYFIPAGVGFGCYNPAQVRHFYIHFDVIGLPNWAQRKLFDTVLAVPENKLLQDATRQLAGELEAGEEVNLARQCRLKALIYQALALHTETIPAQTLLQCTQMATAQGVLLPALHHIEDYIAEPLTNARLAALCHLSEDYFIRQFRRAIGQSPLQYILERRVTLAAQRLLFSSESIEQIALEVGFANRFHFSRVFARKIGIPPAAYRKQSLL